MVRKKNIYNLDSTYHENKYTQFPDTFYYFIDNIQFDFIPLCDTFLTEKNHYLYNISLYNLKYLQLSVGPTIFIGEICRVPWTNRHDSITNYEFIINKLQNENKETIFGTDTNCDYFNINCTYFILNSLCTHSSLLVLFQLYKDRLESASRLLLWLITCGKRLDNLLSHKLVADISEHSHVFVFIGNNPTRSTESTSFEYQKLDKAAIGKSRTDYMHMTGQPYRVAFWWAV